MNKWKNVTRVFVRLLLVALLLWAASSSAMAQVSSASLTGRIEDSSGAGVPGAMVSVTSLETGVVRTVTTEGDGSYRVLSLAVGRYQLKAEKTGFKAAIQSGIDLVVGQQAVVNLNLEVGQVQQQVTVTSEAPVVNTSTESISGLVGEKTVKDLPLNGRSFDQLIALNAGAANTTSLVRGVQVGSGGVGAQVGNYFSVSGRGWGENLFLLNGVEYPGPSQNHSEPGGVSGQLLGVDAVREFNVETDTYGAQYGKRSGAQVSIVTQSGTNQLHGSVFEFLRNSALDARNYFDHPINTVTEAPVRIPPFKRNQFGAALGGPIKKDKTFVFGNYEGFRQRLGVSNVSIDPDANARQGLLPCNVINPTGVGCAGNNKNDTTPTKVPGLQPGMLAILDAYYPVANGPVLGGGTAEAFYNPPQSIREDFGTVRVDHTFSDKDTLGASYLIDDGYSKTPIVDPLWVQIFPIRAQIFSLQETHIFSPNMINTFTAGFSRSGFQFISQPYTPIPTSDYFVQGPSTGQIRITAGSLTAGGGLTATNQTYARSLFTYQDAVQLIKGRHQISFGATISPLGTNELGPVAQGGSVTFASLTTMLQGTAQLFNVTAVQTHLHWRQFEGAWFVQDTIQVRHNLTVRLGLRHEFTNGWNDAHNDAYNYDFGPNLMFGQPVLLTTPVGPTHSIYTENNSKWLFGPRVGIAWDPFGKGKSSVRAGFGTYYSLVDTLGLAFTDRIPPTNGQVAFANQAFLPLIPVNPSTAVPPPCGPGVPTPCTTYAPNGVSPTLKMPTVEEWNLTVEQQITPNTSLRLGYVGSHGYHNELAADPNQIPSLICTNAAGCLAGGNNAATQRSTVAQGTLYVPVTTTLLNPFLSTSSAYLYSNDNSSYNGLNVELTRRFSAGLQFKAAYTWSKDLDFSADTTNIGTIVNTSDPKLSYGPAPDEALPQKFAFSGGYELPFGHNKPWLSGLTGVGGKLVSGWQINSIVSAWSGQCYSPGGGTNRTGNGETGAGPADFNPAFTGPVTLNNVNQWYNPNAFMLPGFGVYGDVKRCSLRGPDSRDVDVSVFKTTSVTERINAQFRAEAFNLFNRANFGLPNTTVFSGTSINGSAGLVTTAATSRQIQFGLKLIF
jgi:hypothetical protein